MDFWRIELDEYHKNIADELSKYKRSVQWQLFLIEFFREIK